MFIPYSICIKRISFHKNWSRSSLTCCERVIEIPNNRFSSKRIFSIQKKIMKGVWGMPWLSEAMKDVTSCDKLRGGANIRYIRRFPNGATRCREAASSPRAIGRKQTRRTETSKYPEEKKTKVIPRVAASEIGLAQTSTVTAVLGL